MTSKDFSHDPGWVSLACEIVAFALYDYDYRFFNDENSGFPLWWGLAVSDPDFDVEEVREKVNSGRFSEYKHFVALDYDGFVEKLKSLVSIR